MTTQIRLRNIRFYAHHGVMEQERVVGNQFVVNLLISAPIEEAVLTDQLDKTLNYAEVYAVVKEQMDIPSDLLEHVAGRILKALKVSFPTISELEVEVVKKNPPFSGDIESASVIVREAF